MSTSRSPYREPDNSAYGSCGEVKAAAEDRVLENRGGGRASGGDGPTFTWRRRERLPKGVAPRTREKDGDGVVCDREDSLTVTSHTT